MDELQAIANIASEITSIGILLLWIKSERADNLALWKIIERLTDTSFKKLNDNDDADNI